MRIVVLVAVLIIAPTLLLVSLYFLLLAGLPIPKCSYESTAAVPTIEYRCYGLKIYAGTCLGICDRTKVSPNVRCRTDSDCILGCGWRAFQGGCISVNRDSLRYLESNHLRPYNNKTVVLANLGPGHGIICTSYMETRECRQANYTSNMIPVCNMDRCGIDVDGTVYSAFGGALLSFGPGSKYANSHWIDER